MILEEQMDAATKAVKDVSGSTREYGTKAVDYTKDLGDKAVTFGKDTSDKAVTFSKDTSDKAVAFSKDTSDKAVTFGKDTSDKAVAFSKDAGEKVMSFSKDTGDRAVELMPFLETLNDYITDLYESGKDVTVKTYTSVKDFEIADKKVAEHAQTTVDTVSDAIDVEQLQDQVTKLRHQMEGVLQNWADTFRPSESAGDAAVHKAEEVVEAGTACPTCGAKGDDPCITAAGNVAVKPHATRLA